MKKFTTQEKYPSFLDDQREFFDEMITSEWHTYQNADWDMRRRFEVDCLFRLVSPRTVLDVGCGCGFHDVLFAEKPGVGSVTGIDYSEKSIDMANRTYLHPNVQRHVDDIGRMRAGEKYDLVVSFQVIEHLSNAGTFLLDCHKHTASGGHIAVVTPNRLRLSNRLRLLAGVKVKLGDPQHFHEYTAPELTKIGDEVGLKCVGGFAYGLTLNLPRIGVNILPSRLGLKLGRFFPSAADCFCVVFGVGA